jgi:oligogalacturonide transport system substrate-binding protein
MNRFMKGLVAFAFVIGFAAQAVFAAENVTLRFSWWGGDARHKPTLEAMKLFEAANPGVTLKGEYMGFGGYPERLTTQISGGNEPDIMQVNWAWVSTMFSKKGDGFYDLNKAKSVLKLDEFGSSINTGIWKGKLNAIPVSFTARTYLYQKTTFDKAGVAIPKTWDDLLAAGKTFETKLGKEYFPIDGNLYDVILMAHAYEFQKTGKQWIDPNSPKIAWTKAECLDFVKFYKKLTESRAVVPLQLRLSTSGPEAPTEQQQDWVKGTWAGNYTWDSTFKTRMSSLPKTTQVVVGDFLTQKGAKNSGFFGRPSLMFAVSKNSKKPLIAAKFINFMLTDPAAVKVLGDSRGIPLAKSAFELLQKENKFTKLDLAAYEQFKKKLKSTLLLRSSNMQKSRNSSAQYASRFLWVKQLTNRQLTVLLQKQTKFLHLFSNFV